MQGEKGENVGDGVEGVIDFNYMYIVQVGYNGNGIGEGY